MIKTESKKRRLDLHPLAAVVLSMVFATSALATKYIPKDLTIGTWDSVNRIYTLNTDVSETIQIDEDNLTLDGAEYTVTGSGSGIGVYLYQRTGVTVKNLTVQEFSYGIWLRNSSGNNTLTGNTANSNWYGIFLLYSSNNTLTGNTANSNYTGFQILVSSSLTLTDNNTVSNNHVGFYLSNFNDSTLANNTATNNKHGIYCTECSDSILTNNKSDWNSSKGIALERSSNNTLTDNSVSSNNVYGIFLSGSSDNQIYNNNFIDNSTHYVAGGSGNAFNLDILIGGNYWSDHTGPDADNDGFVDSPYIIATGVQDNLPWVVQDGWLVLTPEQAIQQLIVKVTTLNIQQGIANSLDAKLDAVSKALDEVNENNDVAAINALGAFINAVEAQRGNKIPEGDVDALIATANDIIAMLSSP